MIMDFSDALRLIKAGKNVARMGWNGKDMYIFLMPGTTVQVDDRTFDCHSHIDMKTVQGYIVPWLASQTDLLENDWIEAPDAHTLSEDHSP